MVLGPRANLSWKTGTVEPKALQSLADDWDGLTDLEKATRVILGFRV